MAPTRRSSSSASPAPSNPSTPNTTPRKTPHCTKCNRPRAGHPRQGCPYVDSDPGNDTDREQEPEQEKITNSLGSMNIASLVPENADKSSAKPVVAEPTLTSLSTNSSIMRKLLMPGITEENTDEKEERLARWQENVVPITPVRSTGNAKSARSPMPGTLNTPSSSFFQATEDEMSLKGHIEHSPPPTTSVATTVRPPRPLGRSTSAEARELFLLRLDTTSTAAPATVYVVPKSDIPALEHSAMKLGFHSRVVLDHKEDKVRKLRSVGKGDENRNDNVRLILGRDERAVQELYESVQLGKDNNGNEKSSGKNPGRLTAAAGGMVVGAVATFTGLAYS